MMRNLTIILILFIFLFTFGCSEEDALTNVPNDLTISLDAVAINQIISELSKLLQPAVMDEPEIVGVVGTNIEGDYQTTVTRYKMAAGFSEQLALDPGTDVIYPGSILDADSLVTGEYLPILAKRAPLTISISLENIGGDKFRVIDEPRLSSVRQAIGDILQNDVTGSTPARLSFTIEEVKGQEHFAFAVGAGVKYAGIDLNTSFGWSNTKIRSRLLVKFIQVYYSIDIDIPYTPTSFFAEDADWSLLKTHLKGSSPVYVSTVNYGRMIFCAIESEEDIDTLRAAVSVAFDAIKYGADISTSVSNISSLKTTTLKVIALGGDGGAAAATIDGLEAVKDYIRKGGNYSPESPGAPISYKLRYLSDNRIASMVLAGEYNVSTTQQITGNYQIDSFIFTCLDEDDSGSAEFYGWIYGAVYTNGVAVPATINGAVANSGYLWNISSGSGGQIELDSGGVAYLTSGLRFKIRKEDIPNAYMLISGHIYEDDPFSDDNLNYRSTRINLADFPSGQVSMDIFDDNGGNRVKIDVNLSMP